LAQAESNLLIKPGEIYMNDDEMKEDAAIVSEGDENAIRGSNKTGMDD
jgi:hypothetical protein